MATLPEATITLSESSGGFAGSTGYCVVAGCVNTNADLVPRVFASTAGLLAEYGYSDAVDYASMHFDEANTPVIFIGLPVVTAGSVGSQNNQAVTGTSAISVAASAGGIMSATSGIVEVLTGTTVGTDQIVLSVSLDGGMTTQNFRLGTALTLVLPYVGITLNFTVGTLNVGDIFTFETTAPMWGSTAMTSVQNALAGQQNLARSWMIIGDLPSSTFAGYVQTAVDAYCTADQRYTYARAEVAGIYPLPAKSQLTIKSSPGYTSMAFASSGHTITRGTGSFITDGFAVGDTVSALGTVDNNGVIGVITVLTATVMTFGSGVVDETGPTTGVVLTGSEELTFAATTITRSGSTGSFLKDGFAVGQNIVISGTTANNGAFGPITAVTATVMTVGTADWTVEVDPSNTTVITQSETIGAWVASQSATFAASGDNRVDLAFGHGFKQSPITGWEFRRPAAWAASLREYQHDVQIPCWRKADGPLQGWSITDANGNVVEFDERYDGGALAGRFTCLRSYGNGPLGAFVALSLTRDTDGALLSRTHNMAVANLASTVVQAETENQIGQVLQLNSDGTGTKASLSIIEQRVNTQLQINLLQQFSEGPRASSAVWSASKTDILNVPGATLNGTLALNLNGTIEKIATSVNVT